MTRLIIKNLKFENGPDLISVEDYSLAAYMSRHIRGYLQELGIQADIEVKIKNEE